MNWSCEFCGKDTSGVDYDYLVGTNHLACVLGVWGGPNALNKRKQMKIKNWNKLNGITYKGYCIGSPVQENGKYKATIYDLNKGFNGYSKFTLICEFDDSPKFCMSLSDGDAFYKTYTLEIESVKKINNVIHTFERLIEHYLDIEIKNLILQTTNANSKNTGILNTITANGSNIVVSGNSGGQISQYNIIDTIKELQKQIDDLKQNTPSNPF